MPKLSANGIEIAYVDEGRGLPILFLHGFADTKDLWQPQIAALADRFRVVAPDLRGHGETSAPADPGLYRVPYLLDDVLALYDHLGIGRAVLCAHSLGGYLSLELYRRNPDRILALMLLAAGPGYRNPAVLARANQGRLDRANTLLARAADLTARGEPPVDRRTGSPLIGWANVCRVTMQDAAAIDILPEITVPTLVLVGKEDVEYQAAAELMRTRIPNARGVAIPGAGHRLNQDQPDLVNVQLEDFLAGIAPAASERVER